MVVHWMLRRGNHFLRDLDRGWFLIDGPWHWYLTQLAGEYRSSVIALPRALPFSVAYPEPPSYFVDVLDVKWRVMHWHPGYQVHPDEVYGFWLREMWNAWQHGRMGMGFAILPEPVLPCYLRSPDPLPASEATAELKYEAQIEHGWMRSMGVS